MDPSPIAPEDERDPAWATTRPTLATSGTKPRTKGQHVLPRFFLNGFASRSRRKKTRRGVREEHHAFLFRADEPPCEPNTRDLAKNHLFYGEPAETGIEDALQRNETTYATVIRRVRDKGRAPDEDLGILLELIGHLAIRGAHVRDGFADIAGDLFNGVTSILSTPTAEEFYRRRVVEDPRLVRRLTRAALATMPGMPTDPLLRLQVERTLDATLPRLLSNMPQSFHELVRPFLSAISGHLDWPKLARQGHIDALRETTTAAGIERVARTMRWTVVREAPHSFVLGDVGPLGRHRDTAEYRPLISVVGDADVILLPLSHSTLLVGYAGANAPAVDVDALRVATARASREFFIASRSTSKEAAAAAEIGKSAALLTEAQSKGVLDGLLQRMQSSGTTVPLDTQHSLRVIELEKVDVDGGVGAATETAKATITGIAGMVAATLRDPDVTASESVRLEILLTDDLDTGVASARTRYGLEDKPRWRPHVAGQSMCLVMRSDSRTTEATLIVSARAWDGIHGLGGLILSFELIYRIVQLGLSANDPGRGQAADSGSSFQEHLEETSTGILRSRLAATIAAPFLKSICTVRRADGAPVEPRDALALEYVPALHHLLSVLEDRATRFASGDRGSRLPDGTAWEVRNDIVEFLDLLAVALGLASDSDELRIGLINNPFFGRYIADDWATIAAPEATPEELTRVFENILARVGLHVGDPLNGSLIVIARGGAA
jgi:uncharacterized protein DUF4238